MSSWNGNWKTAKLKSWKLDYEAQANEWRQLGVTDDRRIFINCFDMVVEALESLPTDPVSYICVAVQQHMQSDRAMMDDIIRRFSPEGRRANTMLAAHCDIVASDNARWEGVKA